MTVGTGTPYNVHTGNGSTDTFAYGFTLLDAGDLVVTINDVETSAFTLTGLGVAAGGTVVFDSPPAILARIILRRVVALQRETDYQNLSDMRSEVVNADFDRLWMATQEREAVASRSLRAPFTETLDDLPTASYRALKTLAFDADGQPIAVTPENGTATDVELRLASTASASDGAAMVGRGGQVVGSIAELRGLLRTVPSKHAFVTGYYSPGDGGGGAYYLDEADTTSADDGGVVIVATGGGRWKLAHSGTVSVKQYGARGNWNGTTGDNDRAAFAAALASLLNVYVPEGRYRVSGASLAISSFQEIRGDENAWIDADIDDYVFRMLGATGGAISSVTAAITALTWTITMMSPTGLSAGDQILLYDVVADVYEVNRIENIISNTVYCSWPITQSFATPANIRLYKLTPVERAHIRKIKITNEGTLGGQISYTYAKDCEVTECLIGPSNYIGITFQSSVGCTARDNRFDKVGASACGLRVTKACRITENVFTDVLSDESITLYKSNSHAVVSGNVVQQHLNGGGPGTAGNCVLLDQHNYFNVVTGNTLEGSATYAIYLFANSSYNTVTHNTINRVNLGAIKVQSGSNGNTIDNNICLNVVDANDGNEGGAATAAIRVKSDCSGNNIGAGNIFANIAGSTVVDDQTAPGVGYQSKLGINTTTPYQKVDARTKGSDRGTIGATSSDFEAGTTGTAVSMFVRSTTGNSYGVISSGGAGDSTQAATAILVPSAIPSLLANGEMTFALTSNTNLRIAVRGSDGTTRVGNITIS